MGFEPFAARLLAERHSRNDIAALRKAEAALKRTLKGPSSGDHGIQLARFHYLIVELTGNMVMTLFADTVSNALERHQANEVEARYDLAAADSDRATFRERGTRSISKLVRLIEAGDAEGTEGHWRRHLRNSNEFWLRGQDPHAPINVLS